MTNTTDELEGLTTRGVAPISPDQPFDEDAYDALIAAMDELIAQADELEARS